MITKKLEEGQETEKVNMVTVCNMFRDHQMLLNCLLWPFKAEPLPQDKPAVTAVITQDASVCFSFVCLLEIYLSSLCISSEEILSKAL